MYLLVNFFPMYLYIFGSIYPYLNLSAIYANDFYVRARWWTPSRTARRAGNLAFSSAANLDAYYIRRPDAEVNWKD